MAYATWRTRNTLLQQFWWVLVWLEYPQKPKRPNLCVMTVEWITEQNDLACIFQAQGWVLSVPMLPPGERRHRLYFPSHLSPPFYHPVPSEKPYTIRTCPDFITVLFIFVYKFECSIWLQTQLNCLACRTTHLQDWFARFCLNLMWFQSLLSHPTRNQYMR